MHDGVIINQLIISEIKVFIIQKNNKIPESDSFILTNYKSQQHSLLIIIYIILHINFLWLFNIITSFF